MDSSSTPRGQYIIAVKDVYIVLHFLQIVFVNLHILRFDIGSHSKDVVPKSVHVVL